MPIIIILILALLIAQIGFWDTFTAVLGGVAVLVLFVLLLAALAAVLALLAFRRVRTRWRGGGDRPV